MDRWQLRTLERQDRFQRLLESLLAHEDRLDVPGACQQGLRGAEVVFRPLKPAQMG